ncbi:MAG: hypothetical protein J0M36_12090 [Caulobacterales bacterium]|nr:hypothetical protein [Caulobacterales bacterium]
MSTPESLPLAEARWLWRRLYVYVVSGLAWGLLAWAVGRAPVEALPVLAHGLMILLGVTMVLYLVAPSAQQLVSLLAEMRLRLATGGGR